jgi:hypothetical protein
MPIHAAGTLHERTADYCISSYIPTIAALVKARTDWTSLSRSYVTGILAACCKSPGQETLHCVQEELLATRLCFEQASAQVLLFSSPNTATNQLRQALTEKAAHILHLACHGEQAEDALRSSFKLSDGELSISELMQIQLPQAVVAFLSACQTAKGSSQQPDQAVHLAASIIPPFHKSFRVRDRFGLDIYGNNPALLLCLSPSTPCAQKYQWAHSRPVDRAPTSLLRKHHLS